MKKTLLVLTVAAATFLASCQVTDQIRKLSDIVAQVQSASVELCGFVPTAQTAAQVLQALGIGTSVLAITNAAARMCAAVTPAKFSAKRGSRRAPATFGTVAGVTIRGHFVR